MEPRTGADSNDVTVSQCAVCKHKDSARATCAAFPSGIPDVILLNRYDHSNEYPGDNGIRYTSDVPWDFEPM